ncbi:low-density lipoprotein receptor class A domain-containing protein 4 [Fopius arisanus]|uniref:C18orf1_0 protein n=1 Tax=Fopius arisanus TaxID=64838 RepID=A0A0C9QII4_9HYME|nr:PREDICTED: low-density lipoprotein receptor class A domain-containing protein 4-like [Fopius arisanus]
MKLRRRCMQTLGVSIKQLRRKLFELGARILHLQAASACDMALVMLTVSAGMEVRSGGHRGGLGGGLNVKPPGVDSMHQEAMVAVARDRAIRAGSVRHDLALDLPPRLQLPDGEEQPYGTQTGLHLRDPVQESEIYQKCVRPPPNRTIFDSESPPPYRSQSGLLDAPDRIVRCHSAGSSLLRVFRRFPTTSNSSGSTPTGVVPPTRRPTLSSYSDSSGNLNNLSSLTIVPCEADETSGHHQHQEHV